MAILAEVFEQLGIESMRIADGAMREGLLYDMVGRFTDEDARERTVRAMQQRYHVDLAQAERVENDRAGIPRAGRGDLEARRSARELVLRWAARLHEIGLDVAHSGYHRHGAYLLENADMPGFPREEQRLLARLVGGHRRKPALEGLEELDAAVGSRRVLSDRAAAARGAAASRPQRVALPEIELTARRDTLELRFPCAGSTIIR